MMGARLSNLDNGLQPGLERCQRALRVADCRSRIERQPCRPDCIDGLGPATKRRSLEVWFGHSGAGFAYESGPSTAMRSDT